MQTIFENGNVVQHTRKIYTMYGNLNGQLNYLGKGYVSWYLTISVLSAETKHMYFNTREIMPHTSINSTVVDDDVVI